MLILDGVDKRFDASPVLDRFDLAVAPGEIHALLGPSGCGKSTLLSLIAGLDNPDRGRISWRGRDLAPLPPEARRFGLMFQDYALFPHLDALDNVAFGLVESGLDRRAARDRARRWLARVGLEQAAGRAVAELSGGERQRVALARTLCPGPDLLLLDEPLSNLDARLRTELQAVLRDLLRETGLTTLLVTHDQGEAFALAGRITVMRAGRPVQTGTAQDLWRRPADPWTARFLGHSDVDDERCIPEEAFRFEGEETAIVAGVDDLGPFLHLALDREGRRHRLRLSRREYLGLGSPGTGDAVPLRIDAGLVHRFAP